MYEYIPNSKKKKELWLVAILSVTAAVLFTCSKQSFCPYPALWQTASVVLLVEVVMLVSNCLLRSFVYRVAPREDAPDAPCDFTVVERRGKQHSTVCRISVGDITQILPITAENRKQLTKETRGKPTYRYYAELSPQPLFRLTVQNEEELFYLFIIADERLMEMLKTR